MIYTFVINGFAVPATANLPIATIKAGAGAPCLLFRTDIAFRASASAWEGFRGRKGSVAETGGTAVAANAADGYWTVAPQCVVKKGTFSVDPTPLAAGTAGSEKGLFTLNA